MTRCKSGKTHQQGVEESLQCSEQDFLMLCILGMMPYVDGVHQDETPVLCVSVSEDSQQSQSIGGGGGKQNSLSYCM